MTIETAREIAARIWCDPEYKHVAMNVDLADVIAHMLLANANDEWLQRKFSGPNYCDEPVISTEATK